MAPRCSVPAFICLHALAALRPPPFQPDSPTLPLLLRAGAPARGRASASACRQRNTAVAARGGFGSAAPSGSWSRPCKRPTARGTASVAWPHGGCRHFALGPRGETEAGGSGPGAFADRSPEDLHIPVLAEEVAEVFRGVEGGIRHFIDGTVGMGGHSSGEGGGLLRARCLASAQARYSAPTDRRAVRMQASAARTRTRWSG